MSMTPLDDLLAPYASRVLRISPAEHERRATGIMFGRLLNRIQGLETDHVRERLAAPYTSGRISAAEFRVVVDVAREHDDRAARLARERAHQREREIDRER